MLNQQIARNPYLSVGIIIIGTYLSLSLFGPLFVHSDPLKQDLSHSLQSFSRDHTFGTDELGRDIASRILFGGRNTLIIVIFSVSVSSFLGGVIGFFGGYFGGTVDLLIMRIIDVLMAFPGLLLALAIVSVLGPGMSNMILAIIIYLIPSFVRISRSSVLRVKPKYFIEAARALGSSHLRIMGKHILPNCLPLFFVQVTYSAGTVVLLSSGLSFLGLGVQRPLPEWGMMLSDGRQYLQVAPHIALIPGIIISLLILGFNLLGEGLTNAFDITDNGY